jgi:hypothetical protein
MQELEATWGRVLSVWWLIAWRGFFGGVVLGFLGGFIAGFVCGAIGHAEWARSAGVAASLVLGLPWGVAVIRMALLKKYEGFRIALVTDFSPNA